MKLRVNADGLIKWGTAGVVFTLAGVAAIASYRHIHEVAVQYGERGVVAYLTPLTVDGLIVAASLTKLSAALSGRKGGLLAWFALVAGIALTLSANILHGWRYGFIGAATAALPAFALTIAFELLMGMIRKARQAADTAEAPGEVLTVALETEAEVPETEAPAEEPKPAGKRPGRVRVGRATLAAVKGFLASCEKPEAVKPEDLADVIPGRTLRTYRAALAEAREELNGAAPLFA